MAEIKLTIPDAKLQRVVDAMKGMFPIPKTQDPETKEVTNDFTDNQWVKQCFIDFVTGTVQRYENKLAKEAATVSEDDTIVS